LLARNLGRDARIFDDGEVIQLLRAGVEREGNQGAFAKRHGIERSYLNQILNGKRGPPRAVLDALGLRKVYAPNETLPAAPSYALWRAIAAAESMQTIRKPMAM
jgi:transcriptional regulator with XRE-family HTH domain